MKYKVYVTNAYYICENGDCEWANEVDKSVPEFESKHVETHKTIKEALDSVGEWGSRWVLYSGLVIEDEKHGEVYSDIPAVDKCKCCGHEKWDRFVSDLRSMTKKDGSPLFPELR